MNKQYSGYDGVPIKYRTNASRQTEEQARPARTSRRQPPSVPDDEMADDGWTVEKPHTSAVRYDQNYPSVSPRSRAQDVSNPKRTQRVRRGRPMLAKLLIIIGLSGMALVLGIMALNAVGAWWQRHTDDVTYGYPRTYQTNAYVGHGDSPSQPEHFIALNLAGVVIVLEVNPQHPQLDKSYYVTTTSDPLKPITVSFPTVDGKQYMYVSIGDPDAVYTVVLVNNGTQFTGVQH